jgi:hypothetical protein
MSVNTDFQLVAGNFFTAVYVSVSSVSKFPVDHAPEQNLDASGAILKVSEENNGGQYGWVTFGKRHTSFGKGIGAGWFFYPAQKLNYSRQIFEPPSADCDYMRIWLKPGVILSDISCDTVNAFNKVLKQVVDILTRKAANYKPTASTATALPLPAPGPGLITTSK